MDIATEVQHEIARGLSVTGGYYHNWDGNIRALVEAGAEVLVAGSAVFGHGDPEAAARRLIEAAR